MIMCYGIYAWHLDASYLICELKEKAFQPRVFIAGTFLEQAC